MSLLSDGLTGSALRELRELRQAVGLASTLAGDVVMDAEDPIRMMEEVVAKVTASREKAERELALARPVIEAAHYAAGVFAVLPLEQQGLHIQTLVRAIRAYDAACKEGDEP